MTTVLTMMITGRELETRLEYDTLGERSKALLRAQVREKSS